MEGMVQITTWPTATDQSGVSTTQAISPLPSLDTTSQESATIKQPETLNPDNGLSSLSSCPEWQRYTEKLSDYYPMEVDIVNHQLRLDKHILSKRLVGDYTEVETFTVHCTNRSQDVARGQYPRHRI